MERPVNTINYAFLEWLSEEDKKNNGWTNTVSDWMCDYDGYFDEDVEEHAGDAPVNYIEDSEDEGIVEDVPIAGEAEMTDVYAWRSKYCVIKCVVYIKTGAVYGLCSKCYSCYIELHLAQGLDHTHVMEHKTLSTLDEAVEVLREKCSSCRTSLEQIITTHICLVCNHF